MPRFKPTYYYESFSNIPDVVFKGKKLVLSDLDNTLVSHDTKLPSQIHVDFVNKLKQMNIEFVIISNNNQKRVKTFSDALGVRFIASTKKPLTGKIRKLLKELDISVDETIFIGDQLLTDIFVSYRLKIDSILVRQVVETDIMFTNLNRMIERFIFKHYEKKGILKKGVYDE